jgi:sortase A
MATLNLTRLGLGDGGPLPPDRDAHRRSWAARWAERLLVALGVLCLGYYLYTIGEAHLYQTLEDRELDKILNSATPAPSTGATPGAGAPGAVAPVRTIPGGSTVGRIEIPRLGVSAVIRAGSDARTLRLAVGYIPGTALPGDDGNVGLAAHRDTFFRNLRDINPDDEIRVVTTDGVFHYYVQGTNIVMPKDVWVLDPTNYPALTLVTCYPFNYIGSAPKRFVVRAALARSNAAVPSPAASTPDSKSAIAKPAASKPASKSAVSKSAVSKRAVSKRAVSKRAVSKPAAKSAGSKAAASKQTAQTRLSVGRSNTYPIMRNSIRNTAVRPRPSDDSRDLQPKRWLRQDHDSRQSRDRARASRPVCAPRRSGSGHGVVDLSGCPPGRQASLNIRAAAPRAQTD